MELAEITPPVPPPPVAVALFFSKRLRQPPTGWEAEDEAMAVASVICGRDKGLTLGPIVAAHEEYLEVLRNNHPVLEMLRERFLEVSTEAEEELLARLQDVERPSEGRACLKDLSKQWGAPEVGLQGEVLFEKAQAIIDGLKPAMEEKLTKHLDSCSSMAGFDALEAELERELGTGYPVLRGRVRKGRRSHREHVESTAQSLWGWPPTGAAQPLARASRWYATELGAEHPVVEDFAGVVDRLFRKMEAAAKKELDPFEQSVAALRAQLDAPLRPPKLVAQTLEEDLQEHMVNALEALERWQRELGCESQLLFARIRGILGDEALVLRCETEADAAAEVLRRPDLGPYSGTHGATEMEERLAAAVRLCQLRAAVAGLLTSAHLKVIFAEFAEELERAEPRVPLLRPSTPDSLADDGWHLPPGFAGLDEHTADVSSTAAAEGVAVAAMALQPAALPDAEGHEALLAELHPQQELPDLHGLAAVAPSPEQEGAGLLDPNAGQPGLSVRMKLHGVSIEDACCKSEILMIERCATIIAEECGIPREWITHLAFAESSPRRKPMVRQPELAAADGANGATEVPTLESDQPAARA